MKRYLAGAAALGALVCTCVSQAIVPPPQDTDYPYGALRIAVDASDVAHRVFNVREVVPVAPGPLTLLYPQWIPGNHGPTGPIDKLAGLVIRANGQSLPWQRDPIDLYAFHVEVPQGARELEVSFQYLSPIDRNHGRVVMTPELLDLQWNTVSLYPAGYFARRIMSEPSVTYPAGWHAATALEVIATSGNTVTYKPIDYVDLVDSPVYAGKYFRQVELDPGAPAAVRLNIFADEAKLVDIGAAPLQAYKNLVQQMYRLYGVHHYDHYDFLLAVSDKLSGIGLEHHRSSENAVDADTYTKWSEGPARHDLLTHEFNHSWDGKYRRPADQVVPNFNVPLGVSLLWVYEGQTQFWGYVMAARSGIWNPQQSLEMLAEVAASFDRGRPGLIEWRTVQDTTADPAMAVSGARRGMAWRSYLGPGDYYPAGLMIWLDVDAKLRQLTGDKRSIDDFCRAFFGVGDSEWDVNPYTFADLVTTLNAIAPYDWASFLRGRLDGHGSLIGGIEAHGWKLVYTDKPSAAFTPSRGQSDVTYSLGTSIAKDGEVSDVLWDGPAFKAGLAPGMKLIAVNGHEYSTEVLNDAISAAKGGTAPIELLVKSFNEYRTLAVPYHDGPQYPHLVRGSGADSLSKLLAPRK